MPLTSALDSFELESPEENTLRIAASSGVAAASGLRHYLNEYAFASISWGRNGTGVNMAHLKSLPTLKEIVRKETKQKYRYYFNAVTFGYSASFWDWERWEIEIDWAAMHGINLFLALEGQEYVWEKLWLEMGVSAVRIFHLCAVCTCVLTLSIGAIGKVLSRACVSGMASNG